MRCALITAGGNGTRLYPLSTKECPKQFCKIFGNKTLIELTYNRIKEYIPEENIFIVLPYQYQHFIHELLPQVKEENVIIEPMQKSTAPCVLYSCLYIKKLKGDTNLFIFPADHYIKDIDLFVNTLKEADEYINNNHKLVLFGIKPTEASTRYGYLKCDSKDKFGSVSEFKEKPEQEIANKYLQDGSYYWSSDICGFNIIHMLQEFDKYLSWDYQILSYAFENELDFEKAYSACTEISTANAIYEKSKDICMIKCNFHWDDVGVFESLLKYTDNKNVIDAYKAVNKKHINIFNLIRHLFQEKI